MLTSPDCHTNKFKPAITQPSALLTEYSVILRSTHINNSSCISAMLGNGYSTEQRVFISFFKLFLFCYPLWNNTAETYTYSIALAIITRSSIFVQPQTLWQSINVWKAVHHRQLSVNLLSVECCCCSWHRRMAMIPASGFIEERVNENDNSRRSTAGTHRALCSIYSELLSRQNHRPDFLMNLIINNNITSRAKNRGRMDGGRRVIWVSFWDCMIV